MLITKGAIYDQVVKMMPTRTVKDVLVNRNCDVKLGTGVFVALGLVAAYMVVNATAIAPPEEAQRINEEVEAAQEDFDAPLDDDF